MFWALKQHLPKPGVANILNSKDNNLNEFMDIQCVS